MSNAAQKVIAIALAEDGYLEKKSNSQLDSKTANAGSANFTKYARDLDALGVYNGKKNGYSWCDMFVDWCFVQAFGLKNALAMTYQVKGGYGAGCTESACYYKENGAFHKAGPKVGDQIFFTNTGGSTMYHTGLVVKVDASKVYTIEGNTSSAAGVVENGGCVRQKSYALNYSKIGGYGTPNYALYQEETEQEDDEPMKVYKYVPEMPAWARDTFTRLVQSGYIAKDEKGEIEVQESSLQPLVYMDRLLGGKIEKLPELMKNIWK